MANLTISVDDELLKRARVQAAEQGTTVDAILREELNRFAGAEPGLTAGAALAKFARENPGNSHGQKWTREELYQERLDRI